MTGLLVGAAVLQQVADRSPLTPASTPVSTPASTPAGPATRPGADTDAHSAPYSPARPPRPLPQAGPGVTEPGVLVVARPTAGGTLDVGEWVVLREPVEALELVPPDVEAARSAFNGLTPALTGLRVTADGRDVPVPPEVVGPTAIGLDGPVRSYVLRYELAGSTVRSRPESAGRALTAFGPVSTGPDGPAGDLPAAVATYGDSVRKLFCPLGPTPAEPCGTGRPPVQVAGVDLTRDTALVFAKIDLAP